MKEKEKTLEQLEKELQRAKMQLFKGCLKLGLVLSALFITLHLIDIYLGRTAFWVVLLLIIFANIHTLDKYRIK